MILRAARWVALLWLAAACTPALRTGSERERAAPERGGVVRVEAVGGHASLALRALFWWQGFSDVLPVERGISLYRVEYWTPSPPPAERLVRASALLALPRGDAPLRGVVAWLHGTATRRDLAPSTPDPANGVLAAAVFAGHGYAVVAPDYLGLGVSDLPHPYYHTATIASSVVDGLIAAQTVVRDAGRSWPDALFLAGFSQGGHAALAAQRALEAAPREGLAVRASATVAGPTDLAGVALPYAVTGRSRFASLYLAWIATTYARVYGEPLETVLRAPYDRSAPPLFDGAHDGEAVVAALPANPRDLLAPALVAAEQAGTPHWFVARLAENSLLDWTPRAPVRAYYGEADADVSPEEARRFAERMRARGADVEAVSVGALDHEGSLLAAAPALRAWFDALAADGAR